MKRLFVVLAVFAALTSAHAVSQEKLKESMTQSVQKALSFAKAQELEQNSDAVFAMFDPMINYSLMARLSLGDMWNSLELEQKKEYVQHFEKKLKSSFLEVLKNYNDEKIKIDDPSMAGKMLHLKMEIVNGRDTYNVVFKFHQAKKDHWLIWDLDIVDVSIVKSFRNQLSAYSGDSFDDLLELLDDTKKPQPKEKSDG
ncbi:MAG: ABC transporter substrate-binding protein [Campylobacterota bacterium]